MEWMDPRRRGKYLGHLVPPDSSRSGRLAPPGIKWMGTARISSFSSCLFFAFFVTLQIWFKSGGHQMNGYEGELAASFKWKGGESGRVCRTQWMSAKIDQIAPFLLTLNKMFFDCCFKRLPCTTIIMVRELNFKELLSFKEYNYKQYKGQQKVQQL